MPRFCVILISYVNSYNALPAMGSEIYFCIGPTHVWHSTWLVVSVSCPFIKSQRQSARWELGEADLQDAQTIFRWIAWLQPENITRGSFNSEIYLRSKSVQSDIFGVSADEIERHASRYSTLDALAHRSPTKNTSTRNLFKTEAAILAQILTWCIPIKRSQRYN